jgi:tRNA pseudouridine38-40 synthase
LQRIRFKVRYDGTEFAGSQVQPGQRTVEGTLKVGLESLLDQQVKLLMASRTDSGVHADGNVAAFDGEPPYPVGKLPELLNRRLPGDVSIRDAEAAAAEFHPRFAARRRTYVYRIFRGGDIPVDRQRYCAAHDGDWNTAAVDDVLQGIRGVHDFSEFAQLDPDANGGDCNVLETRQMEQGAELAIEITANRFLRNMICRLAGAIILVAMGKISPRQVLSALDKRKDFRLQPAPARGLTLLRVDY